MLRRLTIARFALKHSPETEQRLLRLASTTPPPAEPNNESDEPVILPSVEAQDAEAGKTKGFVLSQRQEFHDALFSAVMPEDQRKVLDTYRGQVEHHVGKVEELKDDRDLDEVMQLTRLSIIDELNREERERTTLADAIKSIDTSTATDEEIRAIFQSNAEIIDRYFRVPASFEPRSAMNLLQCLLHKDMERIRARELERETGIRWSFLKADQFEEVYRKIMRIAPGQELRIPGAFSHGNVMYFNAEHPEFTDPENGKVMADRAVTHEATHLAIRNVTEQKFNIDGWISTLRSHPDWDKLKAAVLAVYAENPAYVDAPTRKNERIVDEALAIYATNARHPLPENLNDPNAKAQQEVCTVLQGMFDHPHTGFLGMLKKDLDDRIDRYLEAKSRNASGTDRSVGTLLHDATQEVRMQRNVAEIAERRRTQEASGSLDAAANADEGKLLASDDLDEAQKDAKNPKTPKALLELKSKTDRALVEVAGTYPSIREKLLREDSPKESKDAAIAAIDQNIEWISQSQNDLTILERRVTAVESAETKLKAGGMTVEAKRALHAECIPEAPNPYEHLTDDSSAEEIAAADATFKKHREEILDVAHEVLTKTERIAERIKKGTEAQDAAPASEAGSDGFMSWCRKNIFSSEGHVMWVTPLNIMNIIKIYKEAITENYRTNQAVKENKLAKLLNFYNPIQHTLNKQARSSNEKETSEFLEYIEREGFTFSDVFGPDGRGLSSGLLYQNRHNFNRAKAVLLYAADHAWLYFMDRLHGHDVYGIDYEGIEGHQSFEELVAKHEAGKSHQIDHGVERVDKDPDVAPIMDAMVHELRLKNIFAVQGIMKRLQDKAKFSHSNTWMLTTLLMLIRDECERDPTLKFCLDKGMIDNISNHTIQQSAWSITWLKMLRNQISDWKQKPGKEGFGNNILTQTMEKIEERLKKGGANFPDTPEGRLAKYEAIGMVLSGKTFSEENDEVISRKLLRYGWKAGSRISLFEDEFSDYRQSFNEWTEQASSDPGSTDPDYFNVRNGGSDIMLLNLAQMVKILKKTSTATWQEDEKARGFFAQVFARSEELAKSDPEAHRNFNREISRKLSSWWREEMDDSRRNKFENNSDQVGNNISEKLITLDLVDDEVKKEMNALRWRNKGLQQVGPAGVHVPKPSADSGKK